MKPSNLDKLSDRIRAFATDDSFEAHYGATDIKIIKSLSDRFERFAEWPSVQIELELAPWFWRLGWYSAPTDGHFLILYLGPVRVHVWA